MSQYETIDGLIVESIRSNEPGKLEKTTGRDGFRIIDTQLQALRKAGKIRHATKSEAQCSSGRLRPGWNIVPADKSGEQA